jgi:hypothetical protein
LAVDGVLVWVDPIHEGQTRTVLDLGWKTDIHTALMLPLTC